MAILLISPRDGDAHGLVELIFVRLHFFRNTRGEIDNRVDNELVHVLVRLLVPKMPPERGTIKKLTDYPFIWMLENSEHRRIFDPIAKITLHSQLPAVGEYRRGNMRVAATKTSCRE